METNKNFKKEEKKKKKGDEWRKYKSEEIDRIEGWLENK